MYLSKCPGHVKGAHCVHVGGNDGNAVVIVFGVSELKLAMEVDLEGETVVIVQLYKLEVGYKHYDTSCSWQVTNLGPALESAPLRAH